MIKEAMFYEKHSDNLVQCYLCNHKCLIKNQDFGICRVRQNRGGKLYTLVYSKIIAKNVDPIEKKPLFHFMPGSLSFSIATIGCNFQCGFCQNWQISQYSRQKSDILGQESSPRQIVQEALDSGCKSISYTYTEPTIYFEFALDVAKVARTQGISNIFVTNGYMSKEAIEMIAPFLDAANIDLKSFNDNFYKDFCAGRLQPVLDSIKLMKVKGIWVEITTLVIPGKNDSDKEFSNIAGFIASLDKNIPWHISRFRPDFQENALEPTPLETLLRARDIGKSKGLRNIYVGNVMSQDLENTICWHCDSKLVIRRGFDILDNTIEHGKCRQCGEIVSGVWA